MEYWKDLKILLLIVLTVLNPDSATPIPKKLGRCVKTEYSDLQIVFNLYLAHRGEGGHALFFLPCYFFEM